MSCYSDGSRLLCSLRDRNTPAFRRLDDPVFAGVRWRGPYPTEAAALEALALGAPADD